MLLLLLLLLLVVVVVVPRKHPQQCSVSFLPSTVIVPDSSD